MYEWDNMNDMERALLHFGNRIDIIVGLQMGDKITEEEAYHQIKELYKGLKKIHKKETK
jgi:hypothetical protein